MGFLFDYFFVCLFVLFVFNQKNFFRFFFENASLKLCVLLYVLMVELGRWSSSKMSYCAFFYVPT